VVVVFERLTKRLIVDGPTEAVPTHAFLPFDWSDDKKINMLSEWRSSAIRENPTNSVMVFGDQYPINFGRFAHVGGGFLFLNAPYPPDPELSQLVPVQPLWRIINEYLLPVFLFKICLRFQNMTIFFFEIGKHPHTHTHTHIRTHLAPR
jgi:hypothetical protein